MKALKKKYKYRKEIDGLRAIAVIAVIIFHLSKNILPSGFLGVDIFFVISGYVITSSLEKESKKNFLDFISNFFIRRLKRIYPLLITFVFFTIFALCFVNLFPIYQIRTGIASLFGISNILIYKFSSGYFSPSELSNPFLHTWSLSIEMQFYLIFPVIAYCSGFINSSKNGKRNFIFIISATSIYSLISFFHFYDINQNFSYFLIQNRFWELSIGCLTYLGLFKFKFLKKLNPNWIFIFLILIMFLPFEYAKYSIVFSVFFTSILLLNLQKGSFIFNVLNIKELQIIGRGSFSLYLWHWAFISLSYWTLGLSKITIPLLLILIFAISLITYKYIEKPFRNIYFRRKKNNILVALLSISLTQFIIIFIGISGKRFLYLGNFNNLYNRKFQTRNIAFNRCNLAKFEFEEVINNRSCNSEKIYDSKSRIILLGDSHANMFKNSISFQKDDRYSLLNLTGDNCIFNDIKENTNTKSKCKLNMEKALIWINNNLNENDIIFVSNSFAFQDFFNKKDIFENAKNFNTFYYSLDRLNYLKDYVEKLDNFSAGFKKKQNFYFLISPPQFNFIEDAYCVNEWFRPDWAIKKECFINTKEVQSKQKFFETIVSKNLLKLKTLKVDLDYLCNSKKCSAYGYYDSNHLLDDFALLVLKKTNFGNKISGIR